MFSKGFHNAMGLNGGDIDENMKTIVRIVSGNCVLIIRGAEFGDTRNLEMRRSSPVGQMEAELTCSKYPIRVVCTYGRGILEVKIDSSCGSRTPKEID